MKIKVTKQELRECITHAVIRALNESKMSKEPLNEKRVSDDELLAILLGNDTNAAKAQQAAQNDASGEFDNGDEESTEEVDRGETPYLDAPEMTEDEINNLVSRQINDERIKGVYDGKNYFPRGSIGYIVAFRKWVNYRNANADVDNGVHEGEWGYRPKDVSPKDWDKDPRNHERMFRDMAKKKSQYGNVGDTMHINTSDWYNAGGGDF
jgi:hypothetical protein